MGMIFNSSSTFGTCVVVQPKDNKLIVIIASKTLAIFFNLLMVLELIVQDRELIRCHEL